MDLEGGELWNSGSDRFGHGPYMIADGLILAMDNRGKLTMAEATPANIGALANGPFFRMATMPGVPWRWPAAD